MKSARTHRSPLELLLGFVVMVLLVILFCNWVSGLGKSKPGAATATPFDLSKDNPALPGYLWSAQDSTAPVPIISPVHQSMTADYGQFQQWVALGEACWTEPGTRVGPGSTQAPFGAFPFEVLSGSCRGFRGWVPYEDFHTAPPSAPTATP
jgi:hypothetical protein